MVTVQDCSFNLYSSLQNGQIPRGRLLTILPLLVETWTGRLGKAGWGSGCKTSVACNDEDLTILQLLIETGTGTLGKAGWGSLCKTAGICNARDSVGN